MYQLYYSPGACSLVVHMLLRELEAPFQLKLVTLAKGEHLQVEYKAVNPKARVPALVIDQGETLTEAQAILFYLADCYPAKHLLPTDPWGRAKAQEWASWLAIELHAVGFAKLWRAERFTSDASAQEKVREDADRSISRCFVMIEEKFTSGDWALGKDMSLIDFYLLVFYRWGYRIGKDMDKVYPCFGEKMRLLAQRPSITESLKAEGIFIDK